MSLTPVEPRNEASITLLLEQTNASLTEAVRRADLVQIGNIKAQAATVHEATKQLNLSKEIQLDAQEMIRRSEFWLGKAIRQGQDEGTVETLRDARARAGLISTGRHPDNNTVSKTPLSDIASRGDLIGNGAGIMHLADGVDEAEFEAAVEQGKAEGNLSRANVVRKVKKAAMPTTRDAKADVIDDLAGQGYSSHQIGPRIGVTASRVREIARAYDIEIPADKVVGKRRRIDYTAAVVSTITDLENSIEFIENQLDLTEVDFTEADEWLSSLSTSIRALNRFKQQIKENSHVQ